MGRTAPFLAALGLVILSACSGSADPLSAPTRSPTTTSSAPSPSPSPTAPSAPVMPAAARAHTKAGAKAFVKHFWDVVDYSGATLDASALEALTGDGCRGCQGAVKFVRDMQRGGAKFIGASTRVSKFHVAVLTLSGQPRTEVIFSVSTPEQRADYPGTKKDETYPAGTTRARFMLKAVPGGWRVVLWESA